MANADDNTFKVDWVRVYKPELANGASKLEKMNNQLELYPNPIQNYLDIKSKSHSIKQIALFNSKGSQCFQKSISQMHLRIDTSELKTGVYLLKAQLNNGDVCYDKVIKIN